MVSYVLLLFPATGPGDDGGRRGDVKRTARACGYMVRQQRQGRTGGDACEM